MTEQWRVIPGWDDYEVSDHGRVRRMERQVCQAGPGGEYTRTFPTRIYRGGFDGRGYRTVHLRHAGRDETLWVHRLVLSVFVGEAPEGADACHLNGDRTDNRLTNLRWDSRSENIKDAVRHGTHFNASKTHCKRGHEFTPDNTHFYEKKLASGNTSLTRVCRECTRVRKVDRLKGLVGGE